MNRLQHDGMGPQVWQGSLLEERGHPAADVLLQREGVDRGAAGHAVLLGRPGMNCIKIGLPGKSILSKRKGLREIIFSWK